MRLLIQRIKNAKVSIENRVTAEVGHGLLIFTGVGKEDTPEDIRKIAGKVTRLRIFDDAKGKMNLDIIQVKGEILSVPQFTLFADTRKGNRPGFDLSAPPEKAKEYWHRLNTMLQESGIPLKKGVFAAHMEIELVNDGPVTIGLDSKT